MTSRIVDHPKAWIATYLIAVTSIIYFCLAHWAYDDPFITYRYAYNISHHLGFVYNPGERVLSTTTPLFTILLAILFWLWNNIPHLANLIGAFSLALGGVCIWHLSQAWRTPWVGWIGLLLYPTFPLLLATSSSETPLYLALILAAFVFFSRRAYSLTAVASALATLTRPDGLLVPFLLGLAYLFNEWKISSKFSFPWKAVIVFLVITLPWTIFAWIYFGSPLPVSLTAKQHQGAMLISQRFAPGLITIAGRYSNQWYILIEALLAILGLIFLVRYARPWLLFQAWTMLYFCAYSILGVSRYYWYYAPLVPGFLIATGLGLAAISNLLSQTRINSPAFLRYLPLNAWIVGFIMIALSAGQFIYLWSLRNQNDQRVAIYQAVGKWLYANTPDDARVGALEVGIIGYFSQRSMIDFAGLIQPQISAVLSPHTTYEDAAIWATENYQPDFLVVQQGFFPRLEQGYVATHCLLKETFPGQTYHYSMNLQVFACH